MKIYYYIIFAISLLIISCSENIKEQDDTNIQLNDSLELIKADSILEQRMRARVDTFPLIKYQKIHIKDLAQRLKLLEEYKYLDSAPAKNKSVRTINRKELRFVRTNDSLLIPDKFYDNMAYYSIFPHYYHGARNLKKLIVVSNKWQSYACYEYGNLVRFAAANTGKERTQTYPGRYALVWKQELRKSSLDENWIMPYTWNFHRFAGNAFHKFDMPGFAASHSCVRQFMDDAKWLYRWGEGAKYKNGVPIHLSGTPVIILDVYDYANPGKGPWKNLKSNKDFVIELPEDPMKVDEALIPISQIPKDVRGILPNRKKYLYAEDTLRARGVIRQGTRITESINFNVLRKKKEEEKRKKDSIKNLQKIETSDLENKSIDNNLNQNENR